MTSPVRTYQEEMHKNLGFFATWLPGDLIELGAVGLLQGGRFCQETTLANKGIAVVPSEPGARQDLQYSSTKGTTVNVSGASGDVVATVATKVQIDFSSEGAFVFEVGGAQQTRIANRTEMAEHVLRAYRRDKWDARWLIVEAVYHVDYATIIVSQDKSASITLVATTAVGSTSLLARPEAELSVGGLQGRMFCCVGQSGLSPLYLCSKLKDPPFSEPRVRSVRGDSFEQGQLPLTWGGIQELVDS